MDISDCKIVLREILTSRGIPTVEIEMHSNKGTVISSCPSGASTGTLEAVVLTDKETSYEGKSVKKLIKRVEKELIPQLKGKITEQESFDSLLCKLDGTNNKSKFGANVLLPLSLCVCKTAALESRDSLFDYISKLSGQKIKMPVPHFNIINGGMHAGNNLKFQELMVAFFYNDYAKNLEMAATFYSKLKGTIIKKYGKIATGVGDEGGFAPPINSLEEGLDLIMETYKENNFENMKIALDSAASSFYDNGLYDIGSKKLSSMEMVEYYVNIFTKYPLVYSVEDPFAEDDFQPWIDLTAKIGDKIKIIGDDLTVTNKTLVQKAIDKRMCNGLLVKLNQVGTVSETIEACKLARENGFSLMVSHRSGETMDTFISDFAVGIGAESIKSGAPCRSERVEKYNQLLRISEQLK
ncbi:phosphopyruvate hydratase [Anncaliia algerae PRA339]|uniref:phosphopyruvate hydratase n=1 Tax=Anncaliia algerae PRA339 TaxID=1288291 RepID=A0A059F2B4_9MICR|nr:phosphopyruvate hydratase [Anncaliia algerae PRA339]